MTRPLVSGLVVHLCGLFVLSAGAATYRVDPGGDDANPGTIEKPFRTIQHAAELLKPGDVCEIVGGTYRESIRPARSGTADAPIIFRKAGDAPVIINGTELLESLTRDPDGSSSAPLPAFKSSINGAEQVFLDGEMMILARWPNTSADVSRPTKAQFERFVSKSRDSAMNQTTGVMEDDDLPRDLDVSGAQIYLQPNVNAWSWTLSGDVVERDNGRLTFTSRSDSGRDGGKGYHENSRYYLYGTRALLDAPNEYWIDQDAGRIVLSPAADVQGKRLEVKQRDFAFDLSDRSFITIENIDLFACAITTDRAAMGDGVGYEQSGQARFPWRGKAMGVAPSTGIRIVGLNARYVSHFDDVSGHFFLQYGQGSGIVLSGSDHEIRDSVIQYSAGNGITLLGRGNRALNNLIMDVAYRSTDGAAINTGGAAISEDHEIAYNTILRCGRSGITPRMLTNSDPGKPKARIHHNEIAHCMLQDWDGGGIYSAGGDAGFLRVDHNLVHDMAGYTVAGIYPDYSRNWVIDHNVVWNVEWGILVQGEDKKSGQSIGECNVLIYNNTISVRNTSKTPHGPFGIGWGRLSKAGSVVMNNIIYCDEPTPGYSAIEKYPDGVQFDCNLLATPGRGNPGTPVSPGFVDAASGNFTLKPDSPAIGIARPVPAFDRDGVRVEPHNAEPVNGSLDAGAYEHGAELWTAGSTLPAAKAALEEARNGPEPAVH